MSLAISVAPDPEKGDFELVSGDEFVNLGRSPSKKSKDITWANVNFKVDDKYVLKDCWGKIPSGKTCAIMGPSGAGKSSLLNVLAGRQTSSGNVSIEGNVLVGGVPIDPVAFRKNIAYVMQDDALMATATPREALKFSATMRLPASTTSETIDKIVTKLLSELGLNECADVMIGGPLIKGISGGQRKRTSVGLELITDPTLLFLDEPTSGLDSHSAFNLVKLLQSVARSNCTILCTIHQPSSEVFFLFDYVIYMKDGKIFYQGLVSDIIPYFEKLNQSCPKNYNPSDFIMNLCQLHTLKELEEKGWMQPIPEDCLVYSGSSKKYQNAELDYQVESSFTKQCGALTYREAVATYRDINALIGRFGVTIVLNLLYGLIFLNVGDQGNDTDQDFNSHVGAISMIMIFCLFGSAQSIMLSFPFERPMFLREYTTGTYGAPAYFLSKTIVEIPMVFVQTLVQYMLVYTMMGLRGNFIHLVLASWGLGLVSNSTAMGLGCMVADVKDVTELAPVLFVPQILFAGFFIRTSQIPVFLRWAQYLCGMKYGMNLVLMTEFDLDLDSCRSSESARDNCYNILNSNDIDTKTYYIYIIIMFILFVTFRIGAGMILVKKAKKFF